MATGTRVSRGKVAVGVIATLSVIFAVSFFLYSTLVKEPSLALSSVCKEEPKESHSFSHSIPRNPPLIEMEDAAGIKIVDELCRNFLVLRVLTFLIDPFGTIDMRLAVANCHTGNRQMMVSHRHHVRQLSGPDLPPY